jgi:alanine dehydrogenase
VKAMVGGNYLTALQHRGGLRGVDPASGAEGRQGPRHGRRRPPGEVPAARGGGDAAFEKVIGWNLHPEMLPGLAEVAEEVGLPFEAVELPGMRGGRM